MVSFHLVIDISHWQKLTDLDAVHHSGVLGIICKATQGLVGVDPTFHTNQNEINAKQMNFGAYHYGTGDNPEAQAQHFIDTVHPEHHTLLALDFENNTSGGPTMTLAQAIKFIQHVQNAGHRICLYSGNLIKETLGKKKCAALNDVPLWLAQYSTQPYVPPQWATWSLWQYTDALPVPGITGHVDHNRFNGSIDELRTFWHS